MGFWDVFMWIIVGLIAGVIAKIVMPGKDPGGCAVTILLGIAGAVLAGWLAHFFKLARPSDGFISTGFWAKVGLGVVGAIILLLIYRLIAGRRA